MDVTDLLLRRREMLMRKSSAAGYIQDGLVFHLDGADATVNEWVDRVGGLAFELFNVTVANGGVIFPGNNSSYGRCSDSINVLWNEGTIEVVIGTNNYNRYGYVLSQQSNLICFILYNKRIAYNGSGKTHKRWGVNANSGIHAFSVTSSYMYEDKTLSPNAGNDSFAARTTEYIAIGKRTAEGNEQPFNGTIYQIRIYNRKLTSDEILHNQTIDINKYNITI